MNPFDPMPTIKAILGMTMAQDVAESVLLAKLDDFEPLQCEEGEHDIEPEHHSGAAEYLFITPCSCGAPNFYVCADFATWIRSESHATCSDCGLTVATSALTLYPIAGTQ